MPDFRVYHAPLSASPGTLLLDADESHHLVIVNRARKGDPVVAFDGRGTEWLCTLEDSRKQGALLRVNSERKATPLPFEITLAQALPKGPCMDAIVRKATEIGAARIIPILSERTQVKLEEDRQGKKSEKWRIAALEAAKQCGNPWLPELVSLQEASSFLRSAEHQDLKLIASLHPGARSLKTVLADYRATQGRAPKKVTWFVGPEGDFSPAEMSLALEQGFAPVTLGPLVLRCETAAVYALSILSYELQN